MTSAGKTVLGFGTLALAVVAGACGGKVDSDGAGGAGAGGTNAAVGGYGGGASGGYGGGSSGGYGVGSSGGYGGGAAGGHGGSSAGGSGGGSGYGGTATDGGAGAGGGPSAQAFCMTYESVCHFSDPDHYASWDDCVSKYDGYDANRQACVQAHFELAVYAGSPSSIHCVHAAGAAPCN